MISVIQIDVIMFILKNSYDFNIYHIDAILLEYSIEYRNSIRVILLLTSLISILTLLVLVLV